jgi:RpiB/LacA/LacB family sugar-phosphate isomerase
MINIILPVAGLAKRFADAGYTLPKPLIQVDGVPMIKLAIQSLPVNDKDCRLIFVVRQEHQVSHDIGNVLKGLFKGFDVRIVTLDHLTQGTLCSCILARDEIDLDSPLIIYTPDVCFKSDFNPKEAFAAGMDGFILTFKANDPAHSYAVSDAGRVTRTAEKKVISNDALVGVYCYRDGRTFLKYADLAIDSGIKVNDEFYVAPMYNLMIHDGLRIGLHRVDKMYVLGTPEDVDFYTEHVARYREVNRFVLCCDHSGYVLKEKLRAVLENMDIKYIDFGAYSSKDSDHHDSLKPCIEYLLGKAGTIGIAICSSGQGFNIAANKVKGIRSVLVTDPTAATMGRRHNAANFFCLPSSSFDEKKLQEFIEAIQSSSFDGGRHGTRIRKIATDSLFIK